MVSARVRRLDQRGWTLVELMVVVALIGILAAMSIPFFMDYWRSAAVRAGAQELRTALLEAKQLAIRQRQNVCVQVVANGYRIVQGGCGGAQFWTGTTWSATATTFRLDNRIGVQVAAGPPVFTPLGAAAPGGRFLVTGPAGGVLSVTVSVAGRVCSGGVPAPVC